MADPAVVREAIGEQIEVLAARYGLGDTAAGSMLGLARIVDWRQPNFLPRSDPTRRLRSEKPRSGKHPADKVLRIIAESLAGLELEQVRDARRLADVGSGAGFPGRVLAIALPQTRVALIEKREETCGFLRRAVAKLRLYNVQVVNVRAHHWSAGLRTHDVVTSRNVAPAETIVRISAPLLAPGGAVVVWQKGARDRESEARAAAAADRVGLRLSQVRRWEFSPRRE